MLKRCKKTTTCNNSPVTVLASAQVSASSKAPDDCGDLSPMLLLLQGASFAMDHRIRDASLVYSVRKPST